ncbi:hypothetical protein F5X99DRAFT_414535 [Biscogniauxia marginata]|nr:hypothetical protein F5X99DRAFT_414535 [Biscogniauxia marginata]
MAIHNISIGFANTVSLRDAVGITIPPYLNAFKQIVNNGVGIQIYLWFRKVFPISGKKTADFTCAIRTTGHPAGDGPSPKYPKTPHPTEFSGWLRIISYKVTVVTPYEAQRELLDQTIKMLSRAEYVPELVEIRSVDGAQGFESDFTIWDLTRISGPGFIGEPHLSAVVLTRACYANLVVGNRQAWKIFHPKVLLVR